MDNPADKGGPTCFGITQAVARANGYAGADAAAAARARRLRSTSASIGRGRGSTRSRSEARRRCGRTVRHRGQHGSGGRRHLPPARADRLNRNGKDYPDLTPDGRVGPTTLGALDSFLRVRGETSGETVLLRALEALQGERYLRLAERRPANEAFLYGWLANRIGEVAELTRRRSVRATFRATSNGG